MRLDVRIATTDTIPMDFVTHNFDFKDVGPCIETNGIVLATTQEADRIDSEFKLGRRTNEHGTQVFACASMDEL